MIIDSRAKIAYGKNLETKSNYGVSLLRESAKRSSQRSEHIA
jgi:hypothetical protein